MCRPDSTMENPPSGEGTWWAHSSLSSLSSSGTISSPHKKWDEEQHPCLSSSHHASTHSPPRRRSSASWKFSLPSSSTRIKMFKSSIVLGALLGSCLPLLINLCTVGIHFDCSAGSANSHHHQPSISRAIATHAQQTSAPASSAQGFVPSTDPIFADLPLSPLSFKNVRRTYDMKKEVLKPMTVVELPDHFQGFYQPESKDKFVHLAKSIFDDQRESLIRNPKQSKYAIVSICVGMEICDIATRNHIDYTDKHGYDYILASDHVDGIHPKMLKYLLLTWVLNQGYDWVMMLDGDALITNNDIALSSLIEDQFQPSNSTSLILTRGGNWKAVNVINNGVFLLRNTEWSIQHCFEIFTARYAYTRVLGRTLMDQPIQASILLAQKELQWPPKEELERASHVQIVPKRSINSFYREEVARKFDQEEGGSWETGDFIAHFAAGSFASAKKYSLMVDLLQEIQLAGRLPPESERFPFALPAPGVDSRAGRCWCDGNQQPNCLPTYHVIGVHKAGTKSLIRYLSGHPALASTGFIEDPTRWLTDSMTRSQEAACSGSRELHKPEKDSQDGVAPPAVIHRTKGSRAVMSCSFDDYTRFNGNVLFESNESCLASATDDDKVPNDALIHQDKALFDEMVIWDNTFDRIRGMGLPDLMHRLQPNANLLITVRESVDIVYSAYNHFGVFADGVAKGAQHFDVFVRQLTKAWEEGQCTPSNYRTCLPAELTTAGGWLARAMYSRYLPPWLEQFGCGQVHLFDVSEDPLTEVSRLYEFVGEPNLEAAKNATASTYAMMDDQAFEHGRNWTSKEVDTNTTTSFDPHRNKNPMNRAVYDGMLARTREHLDAFFAPYYQELCPRLRDEQHSCLRVPLFERHCEGATSTTSAA